MSVDIVLVSARPLTVEDLRSRFADPAVRAVLGDASIGGDPTAFPRVTRVDTGRLSVDLFGPQEARTTGAARFTTDLGVAAPKDDEGRTWWTQVDVATGSEDEEAVEALFGVLGSLAAAGSGHVVVNGEIADLAGVEAPLPSLAAPPVPAPTGGRAFVEAFLPTALGDADGWGRAIALVKTLSGGHPELLPRVIEVDGDWRPFLPSPAPPDWWPMEQRLAASDPPVRWTLDPAGFVGDVLTRISVSGELDPTTAADLLPPLLELEASYGFLHYWTPAEPLPHQIGLRQDAADEDPWVLLTPRDLAVALPDLYWAQVIGPPWEEVIGRDRLAGTPAHRVEEVRPHHWLVQLTPDLSDVVLDWPAVAAARQHARAHLGEDLFWRADLEEPRVEFPPVG